MINKIGLFMLMLCCICATETLAKDKCKYAMEKGGYIVADSDIVPIKDIKNMENDSIVTLQGQIEKRINKNEYQFKDSSGVIIVEIDKKIWNGQWVNSSDVVQITGEIEKHKDGLKIDVESLIKK